MYPNPLILRKFYVLTNFTIHFTLCLIFRRVWPFKNIYTICIYICIYLYIPHNEFIRSWTRMFNETVSKDTEILLQSLGLIKYIHGMIHLLYCRHWTDKRKYMPYISVTHKVLKSCRSKMATWANDVYDVHEISSLHKETCCLSSFIFVYVWYIYIYI